MLRTWAGARPLGPLEPARASRSSSRFQSNRRSATKSSARITRKITEMEPLPDDSELVVATPERVSFDYQIAGIGTRAIAQILDLLIVAGILILISFFALGFAVAQANSIANLILIIGSFVVVFG